MKDASTTMHESDQAFFDMHASLGDDQKKAVREWLEALTAQQLTGMATCNPAMLVTYQLRVQQLMALTEAISSGLTTGHLF